MNTSLELQMAPTLPNRFDVLQQRLGPIEHRPIAALKRYENNPRKHPEKQLVKLAASIRDFGFAVPVLIDEVGTIIVGEARVDAASRIGMSEMPVIVAQYWSPAQVRAYRLADNRLAELASWDSEALAIELAAIIEFDETPIEILQPRLISQSMICARTAERKSRTPLIYRSSRRLSRSRDPATCGTWVRTACFAARASTALTADCMSKLLRVTTSSASEERHRRLAPTLQT